MRSLHRSRCRRLERDRALLSIARDPNASRLAAILPLQFVEFLLKLRDSGDDRAGFRHTLNLPNTLQAKRSFPAHLGRKAHLNAELGSPEHLGGNGHGTLRQIWSGTLFPGRSPANGPHRTTDQRREMAARASARVAAGSGS